VLQLHVEPTGRKGAEKLCFRPRQVKPGTPVVALKHHNLTVVIRSNVQPWLCCQHGKGTGAVDGIRPYNASDAESIRPGMCELPFVLALLLRICWCRELKEMRCRNQAPCAFGEASLLGSKIEDRLLVGGPWRPHSLREFDPIVGAQDDWRPIPDSNVVARRQITNSGSLRRLNSSTYRL
jgi:hypothetical protein